MAELNVGNHVIFTLTPQEGAALLRAGSLVVVAPAPNRDDERMPAKATAPSLLSCGMTSTPGAVIRGQTRICQKICARVAGVLCTATPGYGW